MPDFEDIKDKAVAAADTAKHIAEDAAQKAESAAMETATKISEAADKVNEKYGSNLQGAMDVAGGIANAAVDKVAEGADVAYDAIKNKVEEISKKDIDGDGIIGSGKESEKPVKDALEAVKNKAEKLSGKDLDGDGKIGE